MTDRPTEDALHACAAGIILEHAGVVEIDAVDRIAPQLLKRDVVTPEEISQLVDLIDGATVRISWPDHPYVYADSFEDDEDEDEELQ